MNENEAMKYYIAAEKMTNLLYCLEMTMEFMEEFKIVPDEEVKKALKPKIDKMKEWLK
jgi:hypothetical protein